MTLDDYRQHSAYSNPGDYAFLLDQLPSDINELTAVVRNMVVHYRASGITFEGDRLAEIDSRWLARMLASDQKRFPGVSLMTPRAPEERVVGCCRDFTLLTVAALRQHGIPARSRVGFASYFTAGFHHDHVIAEYWNGERWVWVDAELAPADQWGFDVTDIPPTGPHFVSAASVWTAFRRNEIDPHQYGVDPDLPLRGDIFLYNELLHELAHRRRDELLLWDDWGAMRGDIAQADLTLADEIAALLLAESEQELADRYAKDTRLHPGAQVRCISPTGLTKTIDLSQTSDS